MDTCISPGPLTSLTNIQASKKSQLIVNIKQIINSLTGPPGTGADVTR